MKDLSELKLYEATLVHARADRALRSFIGTELEKYHVTLMEWLMLGVICNGPREGLSMSRVAAELDVTLPQVTALANKLLDQKLVKQKTLPQDRRTRYITTTKDGRGLWEEVEATLIEDIRGWLYSDNSITQEDMANYLRVAEKIGNCGRRS